MEHGRCGQCGTEIESDCPGGLCPSCLLLLGVEGPSSAGPRVGARAGAHDASERIGPYRLLDTLGEGGMGIVYLAEQTEPVRRRVAIKVVKPGVDSREVLARFEAERQALAMMNHPNVARVFDAGATEQGRPYVVMEYVPGVPITEYCDLHCLPIRRRLELFAAVCAAIQHAHQKGIIHRDIKPSNVLVSSDDGKPALKVIDFGVAKAMGQPLTERTLFTRHGALLGTPEYMSPEQAGTTAADVDARTDIYSLGVLLYELLVGALPLDGATLRRAAAVEMMRIIREEDPPTPTTKFSSLGATASEVARRRGSDIRSLARQVHGELEWIAMRALEKDPGRRYQSASELAADVQRHLADEPVVARPASRSYLLKKFARKHRAAVTALAASLLVLLAGLLATTALYRRSEAARARAELEATRNRLDSEALQAALRTDEAAYLSLSKQALDLHRRALGPGNPALAPYLVNQLIVPEVAFGGRVRQQDAAGLAREATEVIERALDAGDLTAVRNLLALHDAVNSGNTATLPRLYAKAFELVRRMKNERGGDTRGQTDLLADLLEKGGSNAASLQGAASAERIAREVLAFRREANPSGAPQLTLSSVRLADLLSLKGGNLRARGDVPAAAAAYREALSLMRESGADSPRLAAIESDLGTCLLALGRLAEAEALLIRSRDVLQAQRGSRFATTQATVNRLVDLYTAWGKPGEAARQSAVLRPISIAELRDLGPVRFVPQALQRYGGLGASIDGHPVWVFKETITAVLGEPWRRTDSSWGLVSPVARADVPTVTAPTDGAGTPLALIPKTAAENSDGVALEPGAVVWDAPRHRALIFYTKMLRRDSEERRMGTSLAVWQSVDAGAVRPLVRPGSADPTLLFDGDEPPWGSGAVIVGDWLYAYACAQETNPGPYRCRLARVPLDRATDRPAWRFFGRGGWSADWREGRYVMDALPPMSVAWNGYVGKYVSVSTRVVSSQIRIQLADRPEGPWPDDLIVDAIPPDAGWPWIGWGAGHPELSRDGGRVEILTYGRGVSIGGTETRAIEIQFRRR